jgi:hypothetical protein
MDLNYKNTVIRVSNGNQQEIVDFYKSKGFNYNKDWIDWDINPHYKYIGIVDNNIDSCRFRNGFTLINLPIDIWI